MPPRGTKIAQKIAGVTPGQAGRAINEEVQGGTRAAPVGGLRGGARREGASREEGVPSRYERAREVDREVRERRRVGRKVRHRIGAFQAASMIGIAMFFDFLQLILTFLIIGLIINTILSVVIFLIFLAWFSANGVNYFAGAHAGRRFFIMSATFLAKLIPGINMLPLWTIRVIAEIRLVHSEDRQYNKRKPQLKAAQ